MERKIGLQVFDHLNNTRSLTWASNFSGQTKEDQASQTGPRFLAEQNLWLPHSVTAWERPTSAGWEMPALPFDLSFKLPIAQVRDFRVHTPNGKRGAGQEQSKKSSTLFFGQFHMTYLALYSIKSTLKMECDITWYNGVNKWHSSELLQQNQSS